MNTLKSFILMATVALASSLSSAASAQAVGVGAVVLAQASTDDMTDGEIRKVDNDTKKITI